MPAMWAVQRRPGYGIRFADRSHRSCPFVQNSGLGRCQVPDKPSPASGRSINGIDSRLGLVMGLHVARYAQRGLSTRCASPNRRRPLQPGHRARARPRHRDCQKAHQQHLHQAQCAQPHSGCVAIQRAQSFVGPTPSNYGLCSLPKINLSKPPKILLLMADAVPGLPGNWRCDQVWSTA